MRPAHDLVARGSRLPPCYIRPVRTPDAMATMRVLAAALCALLNASSATARKYEALSTACQDAVAISGDLGANSVAACEAKCDAQAAGAAGSGACRAVDTDGKKTCYLKSVCHGSPGLCDAASCGFRAVAGPPPPAEVNVSVGQRAKFALPKTVLGCHSDEGFMHQPQFFLSQMVYGEAFEETNGMKSGWSSAAERSAQGGAALDKAQTFGAAMRPSMKLTFGSGVGSVRLAHRGMGNEGLVLRAGQDYTGYIFARAEKQVAVTVALRDYKNAKNLASATVTVPGSGHWVQLNYTLIPSASTTCMEADPEDPDVSCNNAFPDYICIKCGGELSYSVSEPGSVWIGYARLEPGEWGRWAGLPIRVEAADTLRAMGITALRYGGSVGSSVSWKDFRGPVWNRTGLGRTWAACDMSGWGPFDAMDAFASLNISVAVVMSDSDTPEYLAELVEYCLGDERTLWGAQRIADGHPSLYQPYAWEIGNEQYNHNFVAQVAAMEAKAAELGHADKVFYMFPDNGGMTAADQAKAVRAGLPIHRIATDVHVGSAGGIQKIAAVFAQSPDFHASAINGEVNAIYGDGSDTASAMGRALSEAVDINDWLNYEPSVLNRTIARTASFCSERNGHDDGSQWHQGLSFFLPNMTWLVRDPNKRAFVATTLCPRGFQPSC